MLYLLDLAILFGYSYILFEAVIQRYTLGITCKVTIFVSKLSKEKPTIQFSIVKPYVVLGPILCWKAEANVEVIRRGIETPPSGQPNICISVCDVRDVAEAHIEAMNLTDEVGEFNHVPGDCKCILPEYVTKRHSWFSGILFQKLKIFLSFSLGGEINDFSGIGRCHRFYENKYKNTVCYFKRRDFTDFFSE